MIHRAAHLLVAALFVLGVRANVAQQPAPGRNDPYSPQYQPAPTLPGSAGGRYPLPQQPAWPSAPAPQANYSHPNAPSPAPVVNQALRYPLPGPGSVARAAEPAPAPAATASAVLPAGPALPPQAVLFAPGQIVARVGDKTILYCDVAPTVDLILAPIFAKAKNQAEIDAIEAQLREALTKHEIQKAVQNKMLLMEFERSMPAELRSDATKRAASEAKLRKQVSKAFENSLNNVREKVAAASQDDIDKMMRSDPTIVRLALLMKDRKLESPGELDTALREFGTTLDQQVRDFGEYMMGIEAARSKMSLTDKKGNKKEITHQEMLDYYQAHAADFQVAAKARFEILTARLTHNGGDRQATQDLVARMGNEVLFGGTPFPAVARKYSQEPNASEGGYYDWVTPGSLASKSIDRAIFTLEVDKLSQIIEDEAGFHIIRVIERQEAGQVSFLEAQQEIRQAIESQRRSEEQQKYLTDLRARTQVWTIYDPPGEATSSASPSVAR